MKNDATNNQSQNYTTHAKLDVEALIDTVAPSLGINIRDEWRQGVNAHLTTAAKMADLLANATLTDKNDNAEHLGLANTFFAGPLPSQRDK